VILYAESSAVLRWLFNDALADEVFGELVGARKVVCSRLTPIECRRAVRRAVAESRITEAQVGELLSALAQSAARWAMLELTADVAERAGGRFPVEPVRTLDAIHLASMAVLRESIPDLVVLSTDARVRENSAQLGFEVRPAGPAA
jgi:predicted nucleic acid-binding protein